jgi:outer membrane protein with beta-barrel domain
MRRLATGLCTAVAVALLAMPAHAVSVGIGAFGGASFPLVQDDNGQGSVFGVRVPVSVVPLIAIEPYFGSTHGGSKDQTVAGLTFTRDGIDVTSYGANLLLKFGGPLQFYPFAGMSSSHLKRTGLDETDTAYDFGLGLGIKLPLVGLSVDGRGELDAAVDKASSDASRKWANVTLGVSYAFAKFPPIP